MKNRPGSPADAAGIVSGRPVADLQRFLGMGNAIELWGSHGIERLTTTGCWVRPPPASDASRLLGEVAAVIVASGGAHSGTEA